MKSDKPSKKSLVCGSILFIIAAVLFAAGGLSSLSSRLGYVFGPCVLAIIITGTWGYFSKKPWSWIRFGITILILFVAFLVLPVAGRSHHGNASEIERKTFSMTLPKGWTEDTKDDMYDPNSFVIFENSASCIFMVIVGKTSAGATVEDLLKHEGEELQKRVTESKSTDIKAWSKYEGKGFELEGKVQGITRSRARIFGFQNGDNVSSLLSLEGWLTSKHLRMISRRFGKHSS
jgi:hypothetical protein